MPIKFNNKTKEFHIMNKHISYIFKILENGQLGHLYFGSTISHVEDFSYMEFVPHRGLSICSFEDNLSFSLEHIMQEYPCYGTSDFSEGVYQIKQKNGSIITDFRYDSHVVFMGKKKIDHGKMPGTFGEDNEVTTLEILLHDDVINADMILSYTIFENLPVIARHTRWVNKSDDCIRLTRALSANFHFDNSSYELVHLSGAWIRERHIEREKITSGIKSIGSTRGASSANHNPFMALCESNATEDNGRVYGFALVYSGSFYGGCEVSTHGTTRISMGIQPFNFEWKLEKNECFCTPEMLCVYSEQGFSAMTHTYHKLFKNHLMRGRWKDKPSPILINNWEATYFGFDEESIIKIAQEAKALGVELFVLDDGWFGNRNDDKTSLGDWFVNKSKLPSGIGGLGKKLVEDIGIEFGLWFEPEMISVDSDLFRQHPEWRIETPMRKASHGRNQFVLNFTNEEVIDYIFEKLAKIFRCSPISYVKWDMNRNISECYGSNLMNDCQGEFFHRYILGVYSLYEKLITEFPYILFESCASGGGRFDAGMLYFAPQGWISDDTDAVERLKIQYGTSMIYPLRSMGSHVSDVPNHQVIRNTSFSTRANVAYFGTFGYELNPLSLSEDEKLQMKKQIDWMKKYRNLIQYGLFYRLKSPFEGDGNIVAWMVVSEDKTRAILGVYQVLSRPNPNRTRIILKGLEGQKVYKIGASERQGDSLMSFGISLNDVFTGVNVSHVMEIIKGGSAFGKFGIGDFSSEIFEIVEKGREEYDIKNK